MEMREREKTEENRKMRLWSLHPGYLDTKGLIAVWREALLAKSVLLNKTKGYKNHPQLIRFKRYKYPVKAINSYLQGLFDESQRRGFNFNYKKIGQNTKNLEGIIPVTSGQIEYEFSHLLKKFKIRDKIMYNALKNLKDIETHPIFIKVKGGIEPFERQR